MISRLIIIEGLPGAGKSTLAKLTKNVLDEMKIENELFNEGNLEHPADYDGVAYFSNQEFKNLLCCNENHKEFINQIALENEGNYFIPYVKEKRKLGDKFDNELFYNIVENDIYELPLDIHIKLLLDKWEEFAKSSSAKTIIFECCFIQNPVTVSLIRDNSSKEITINYIKRLAQIIEVLNPILIYVNQSDVNGSFRKIVNERPKEWLESIINYYTNQGFGKLNNLRGIKGVIEILNKRKELELEIFNLLEMKKFIINNSEYNTEKTRNEIKKILG